MKDLVKIGNSFNIPLKTYIADFEEDLDIILKEEKPPVGSIVEVINTGIYKKYKIGNDLKWYEIPIESSGGGCDPEDYKLQEKRVVPSTAAQVVTPDVSYYGLSKVNVDKIPENYITTDDANATPEDLMIGKTAYVQGQKITGTKEDETYVLPLASENELGGIKASEKDELDVQECKINTENGKLYTQSFDELLIKDTIEGNPAVSNSSADWRVPVIGVYGKSTQVTTQGNQLFNKNQVINDKVEIIDTGLKVSAYAMPTGIKAIDFLTPNKTIYCHAEKFGLVSSDNSGAIQLRGTGVDTITLLPLGNTSDNSVQLPQDLSGYELFLYGNSGGTAPLEFRNLYLGYTPYTSYEPYTGGQPSPSPDYPQEIKSSVVTGIKITDGAEQEKTIPLTTPVTLRGIPSESGNVTIDGQKYLSDYIGQKDGVYGVFRKTQEIVDNGSNQWGVYTSQDGFYGALLKMSRNREVGLCNQAQVLTEGKEISSNSMWIGISNGTVYFLKSSFYNPELPDNGLANWKAHLAENPLKIITVADEETFEPLPEQDNKALSNLKTFYPTSIISGVTEDGQGIWVQSDIVCDPKNYINNETEKIKNEIQSQLLSTNIALLEEI